ncbi:MULTISPECIES: hypothetical protein [unclassified Aeromicrobium]|uniref:hypothetical protein n=1 Tax=unclassified Aeromicrobium TaxID=2633570 RepID=UPI00288C4621|nr:MULTISPECIES: hypothetical protein [unclassified Aeromicrobium]
MKTRAVALVVAILLVTGTWASAVASHQYEPALEAKEGLVFVGGPIRLGSAFALHANSTHAVPGVKSVKRRANCDIEVDFESKKGDKVVSVLVDEDETMSRLGVSAGASGGLYRVTIQMWRNGKKICPQDKRFGKSGNLWLQILIHRPSAAVDESGMGMGGQVAPQRTAESDDDVPASNAPSEGGQPTTQDEVVEPVAP